MSSQCSECLLSVVMKFNIIKNLTSLFKNVLVNIDINCESLMTVRSKLYISNITLKDDIFLRRHNDSKWDVKFYLKILKHLFYLSYLKICFKICLHNNTCSDLTLSIFLISDNISIISVKKIIKTNLAHYSDLNSINCCKNKILKHVHFDHLWSISIMYNLRVDVTNLSVTELYDESILKELEIKFNMLHTIFKNFRTVKLIAQSHVLNHVIINLMMLFEIKRESSFLNIWYSKHFIKHFIQCDMYSEKENQSMIDISTQESFISFDEYIIVLEFKFIQKHKYQVCVLKTVSETIVRLQLIDISNENKHFIMNFIIFSKTLMMCL